MKKILLSCIIMLLGCVFLAACESQGNQSNELEKEETVLSIFALGRNPELERFASAYEAAHPNVTVIVDYGKSENADLTKTQILNNLNTEILNGEGSDLICFETFSKENYEDVLLDLTDIVEQHEECCYSNILSAYEKDGKIAVIPLTVSLTTIGNVPTDRNEFTSLSDLKSYIEQEKVKVSATGFGYTTALLTRTYVAELERHGMEKSEMTAADLYELFDLLKSACAEEINLSDYFWGNGNAMLCTGAKELFDVYQGKIDFVMMYLDSSWELAEYFSLGKENWKLNNWKLGDSAYFAARTTLGINANTKNKELAEDFISYCLSKDVQMNSAQLSIKVNREALIEELKERIQYTSSIYEDNGKTVVWEYAPLTEETEKQIHDLMESGNLAISNNEILVDMILDNYIAYLNGEMSKDKAIELTTQKIRLYFMEQ